MQAAGLQTPHDFTPRHIMRRVSETATQPLSDLVDTLAPNALLQDDVSTLPAVFNDWHLVGADSFALKTA
jgi:hypothetical protein